MTAMEMALRAAVTKASPALVGRRAEVRAAERAVELARAAVRAVRETSRGAAARRLALAPAREKLAAAEAHLIEVRREAEFELARLQQRFC